MADTSVTYWRNVICIAVIMMTCSTMALAQDVDVGSNSLRDDIAQLESQVRRLESKNAQLEETQQKLLEESGGVALALFLFGAFCALWAQNTGRSAWLWFFLGLLFSVITVLFLLAKNAEDLRSKRRAKQVLQ